ncbi:hypothetical protein PtB15_14B44 [Puccinia triticina]|nr:hypothetical protein PtB15_14B44 [Puccinia triticina]
MSASPARFIPRFAPRPTKSVQDPSAVLNREAAAPYPSIRPNPAETNASKTAAENAGIGPIQPLAGRPNTLIHPNLEGAARVAEGLPVVPDVDPQGSSDEDNDESHTDTDESENPPPATHSALAPAPPVTSARKRDDASNIQQLGQYL